MHTTHCRLPRAGVDRIDAADVALSTIAMAMHWPMRHETIVVLLDETRSGRTIVAVSGTEHPDAVIEVVECLALGRDDVASMVVASVRPTDDAPPTTPAVGRSDVDRWLELSDITEAVGVEVVEWFVIGREIICPRDALGEAPRW